MIFIFAKSQKVVIYSLRFQKTKQKIKNKNKNNDKERKKEKKKVNDISIKKTFLHLVTLKV